MTDSMEEIFQRLYINKIQTIKPSAIAFAKNVVRACEILTELMSELEHFKKSKKIPSLIIKINDIEEECDKLTIYFEK